MSWRERIIFSAIIIMVFAIIVVVVFNRPVKQQTIHTGVINGLDIFGTNKSMIVDSTSYVVGQTNDNSINLINVGMGDTIRFKLSYFKWNKDRVFINVLPKNQRK